MPLVFNSISAKTCESPIFNLNIFSEEGESISYGSSDNSIASVDSNGNVTIYKAGIINITGYTPNYTGIRPLTVNKINQTYILPDLDNLNIDSPQVQLPKYTDKNKLIVYSNFTNEIINLINDGSNNYLQIKKGGTAGIGITEPGNLCYNIISQNKIFNIAKRRNTLTFDDLGTKVSDSDIFNINAISNNINTPIQYSSSDPSVAEISQNGNVTIKNIGEITITTTQNENDFYSGKSISKSLKIIENIIYPKNLNQKILPTGFNYNNNKNNFGYDVDINDKGDFIAISNFPQNTINELINPELLNICNTGSVSIYSKDQNNFWSLQKTLYGEKIVNFKNINFTGDNFFGKSISFNKSGNMIAIGAPGIGTGIIDANQTGLPVNFSGAGNVTGLGKVYLYLDYSSNSPWLETITGGQDFDGFGYSVSLFEENNDYNWKLLVGAPYAEVGNGRAYFYNNDAGSSDPVFILENLYGPNYFGASTAINETSKRLAVGAPDFYNTSTGYVYLYDYSDPSNIVLINQFSGLNHFGSNISFNESGNVLAIASDSSVVLYKETGDNLWTDAKNLIFEYQDSIVGWGSPGPINSSYNSIETKNILKNNIIQLEAGERFSMVLLKNGTVTGWGPPENQDVYGWITSGKNLTGIKKIAVGASHILAILNDNSLTGWGDNTILTTDGFIDSGVATGGNNLTGVIDIWAGFQQSVALLNNGNYTGWGYDDATQNFKKKISKFKNMISISISKNMHLGLACDTSGVLTGWSSVPTILRPINNGETIYGVNTERLKNIKNIEYQRASNVLFLFNNGDIVGIGDDQNINITAGNHLKNVKKIRCGVEYNLALLYNRTITGWGNDSTNNINYGIATGGNNLIEVEDIAAGYYHSIASTTTPIKNINPIFLDKITSIDLNAKGNVLIAGNSYFNTGYVFTGNYRTFEWVLKNKLTGSSDNSMYGLNVATDYSGNYTIIGANQENPSGSVYTYKGQLETSSSSSSSSSSSVSSGITSPSIAIGKLNVPFSYQITTSFIAETYNLLGTLPPGLTFNSTSGLITGTITNQSSTLGNYVITIQASDGNRIFSKILTIYFLRIVTTGNISFNINESISIQTLTYGDPDLFQINGLPQGLRYDSKNGMIIGFATEAGSFPISITISKSNEIGQTVTETNSTNTLIFKVKPKIISALSAEGEIGTSFAYKIEAEGSPSIYSYTIDPVLDTVHSVLPNGLSFNGTTGIISGIPIVSGGNLNNTLGLFVITLKATKNGVDSDPINLILKIKLKITNTNIFINNNINETLIPYQVTADGSPTTFLAEGLPNGLVIDSSTGIISGLPRIDGLYNVLLKVKNQYSEGEKYITFNIKPRILNIYGDIIFGKVYENLEYEILSEGQIFNYSASFSREDNEEISLSYLGLYTEGNKILGQPNRIGKYIIILKISNSNNVVEKRVILQVAPKIKIDTNLNHEIQNLFEYKIKVDQGIERVDYVTDYNYAELNLGTNIKYKFISGNNNTLTGIINPSDFPDYTYISIENDNFVKLSEDFSPQYVVGWYLDDYSTLKNDYIVSTGSNIALSCSQPYNIGFINPNIFLKKLDPPYTYYAINLLDGLKVSQSEGKIRGYIDNIGTFYIKPKISNRYGTDEQNIKITCSDSTVQNNIQIIEGKSEIFSEINLHLKPLTGERFKSEYIKSQEPIWASYDLRNKQVISGSGSFGMNYNDVDAFTIDFITNESGVLNYPSLEYKEVSAPLNWSCLSFKGAYEKECSTPICYICQEARIKYKNNANSMLVRKNLINWSKYDKYFTYQESDTDPYYYQLSFTSGLFEFCCDCIYSKDPKTPPPCAEKDDSSLASLYQQFSLTGLEAIQTGKNTILSKVFFLDDLAASLITQKYDLNFYSGSLDLKNFEENDVIQFKQYPFDYPLVYKTIYNKIPTIQEVTGKFIFSKILTGENYFSGRDEFVEKFNNKLAKQIYQTWVPLKYDIDSSYINGPLISGSINSINDDKVNLISLLSGKLGSYDISLDLQPRLQIINYLVPEVISLQGSEDGMNWQDILTSQNLQPVNVYLKNKNITGSSIEYGLIEETPIEYVQSYQVTSEVEVIPEGTQDDPNIDDLINKRDATKFTSGKYLCVAIAGASGIVCGSGYRDVELVRDFCVPTGEIEKTSSSSLSKSSTSNSSISKMFKTIVSTVKAKKTTNSFRVGFYDYKSDMISSSSLSLSSNSEIFTNLDYSKYKINDYIYLGDEYFEFDNYKWIDQPIDIFGDIKYIYGVTPFNTLNIVKNRLVGFFPRYINGIFTIKIYVVDKEDRTTEHSIKILVNENLNPCPPSSSSSFSSSFSSSSSSSSINLLNVGQLPEYLNRVIYPIVD